MPTSEVRMFHDRGDRIDWLLLRPLGMTYLCWACISAVRREWTEAFVFLIGGFFGVVWVARGLFPDRSGYEFAHPDTQPQKKFHDGEFQLSALITRAAFRLAFLLGTMFAILLWHSGATFVHLIGGSIAIYFGTMILVVVIACFPFRVRKEVRAQEEQEQVRCDEPGIVSENRASNLFTELDGRAAFDEFVISQLAREIRTSQPVTVLLVSPDSHSLINARYGHEGGYAISRWLSDLLQTAARSMDLVVKYGGEEVALILPATSRQKSAAIAETIRRAVVASTIPWADQRINIKISIGGATSDRAGYHCEPRHLLKAADLALCAAKADGGNCVKILTAKKLAV
jgi:diguanylate cyclase (GGDEF)-like protein